jgi:hypothetical protein
VVAGLFVHLGWSDCNRCTGEAGDLSMILPEDFEGDSDL